MAADVALALVVVRAGVLISHAGVSQQLGGLQLGVPGDDACLGRAASSVSDEPRLVRPDLTMSPLTCRFTVERVTGIEPALSAWESVPSGPVAWPDLRVGVSASDREGPLVAEVNGPLMAQRSWEAAPCQSRQRGAS
jgi:hypothetical protein